METKIFTEQEIEELERHLSQAKNLQHDIDRRRSDLEIEKAAIMNDIKRFDKKLKEVENIIHAAKEQGWIPKEEKEKIEQEENRKRKEEKLAKEAEEKMTKEVSENDQI